MKKRHYHEILDMLYSLEARLENGADSVDAFQWAREELEDIKRDQYERSDAVAEDYAESGE